MWHIGTQNQQRAQSQLSAPKQQRRSVHQTCRTCVSLPHPRTAERCFCRGRANQQQYTGAVAASMEINIARPRLLLVHRTSLER